MAELIKKGIYRIWREVPSSTWQPGTKPFYTHGALAVMEPGNEKPARQIPMKSPEEGGDELQHWAVEPVGDGAIRLRNCWQQTWLDLGEAGDDKPVRACKDQSKNETYKKHQWWIPEERQMAWTSKPVYTLRNAAFPEYYLDNNFLDVSWAVKGFKKAETKYARHQEWVFEPVTTVGTMYLNQVIGKFPYDGPQPVLSIWDEGYAPVARADIEAAYRMTSPFRPPSIRRHGYMRLDACIAMRRALTLHLYDGMKPGDPAPAFIVLGARNGNAVNCYIDEQFCVQAFDPAANLFLEHDLEKGKFIKNLPPLDWAFLFV